LVVKRGFGDFGRFPDKAGAAMFCCQKTILRCGGKAGGAGTAVAAVDGRHFDVAAIGGSGVAGLHPFDFSSRPRASRSYGQVLRSIDI
jgi:hypothetical protein